MIDTRIRLFRKYIEELFKTQSTYVIVVYTICIVLFFLFQQYLLALLLLGLLGIFTRFADVIRLRFNAQGIEAEFVDRKVKELKEKENEVKESMEKANVPLQDQHAMQDLVDETFRLGYIVGGGKISGTMNNVSINRDEEGNILGVSYDET